MHQDNGNSGSVDFAGPLGINVSINSLDRQFVVYFWGSNDELTAAFAYVNANETLPTYALGALDPSSLDFIANWNAPTGQTLNPEYSELSLQNNTFAVSSQQGMIWIVQRYNMAGSVSFRTLRSFDLHNSSTIASNEVLLNSMFDAAGNIWFTTGTLQGVPTSNNGTQSTSSVVGYIEPDGTIHKITIPNQVIENGMSVSGTSVFCDFGPPSATTVSATGSLWAFAPGSSTGVTVQWNQSYDAGSRLKPGGFARGSGESPMLLGDQYVAITDNADSQIHLLVYHQNPPSNPSQSNGTTAPVCSVPLFKAGSSANDVTAASHFDGSNYGITILNDYNAPPLYLQEGDINGPFNNMTGMEPGLVRVDVASDGSGCSIRWNSQVRMKSVPVLSTQTGLLYGYVQDEKLAKNGTYEWYVTAIDWDSGEVEWQVRTGAGGTFNDNFLPGSLGPDGTFYQPVIGGVVFVRDGTA